MGNGNPVCVRCVGDDLNHIVYRRNSSFLGSYTLEPLLKRTNSNILRDDNDFFQKEDWCQEIIKRNGKILFDAHSFLSNYKNYKLDQIELQKHWIPQDIEYLSNSPLKKKRSNCLSPDWKILIRKGVPMKYMRTVILFLFRRNFSNNELEYNHVIENVFKGRVPKSFKNCPSFSEKEKLEDNIKFHVLNNEGLLAMKRILWVLKETFYFIEYSPMIIQILGILLIFLNEAESYCCIKSMIDISREYLDEKGQNDELDLREMRWYFTFNAENFAKMSESFFEEVRAYDGIFKQILKHFTKVKFNYILLFQQWTKNLFLSYLPLQTAFKVFVTYLNEGIKIYFRVSYGLCYMLKEEIFCCEDKGFLMELFHKKSNDFNMITSHKLLKISYALTLSNMKATFAEMKPPELQIGKSKIIFRPRINESSSIISDENFETVWQWIPNNLKLSDATLLFSTRKNGFSLANLYQICLPFENNSIIILIKNDYKWIFGAFCDKNLFLSNEEYYRGTHSSFLFLLSPCEQKFESTLLNNDHLRCDSNFFSFGGGGDGVAFYIDCDLNFGRTYHSETYNNYPFNGNYDINSFTCIDLELYVLI